MEMIKPLERYTPPTPLDKLPFGTICRDGEILYIQLGEQDSPKWQSIGVLLEIAYKESLLDREFIDAALKKYREKRNE